MDRYIIGHDPKPMTRLWRIRRWLAVKLYPPLPWADTTTDGQVDIKMPNGVTLAHIDASSVAMHRDAWI